MEMVTANESQLFPRSIPMEKKKQKPRGQRGESLMNILMGTRFRSVRDQPGGAHSPSIVHFYFHCYVFQVHMCFVLFQCFVTKFNQMRLSRAKRSPQMSLAMQSVVSECLLQSFIL